MLAVEGATYEDALEQANNLLMTNLWGDGLPMWPATRERVDWILRGTRVAAHACARQVPAARRHHHGGNLRHRAGDGGRAAGISAGADCGGRGLPRSGIECRAIAGDFGQRFPVVIVNGPIAKQIRLNSGFGCLGPDPQRPAAPASAARCACCSRTSAARCRASARWRTTAACATPTWCSPKTKTACPQAGRRTRPSATVLRAGTNSVSLVFANGATNIRRRGAKKETPEEDATQGMYRMADFMRTPNLAELAGYEQGTPGVMMMPRVVAQTMAKLGWTKQKMREFFWEHSKNSDGADRSAPAARRGSRSTPIR